MGTDATKRYVSDVLELMGLKGNRKKELRVSEIEVRAIGEELEGRARDHHSKNWESLAQNLVEEKQPKGILTESPWTFVSATMPEFLTRAAFYYNKLVVDDPLDYSLPQTATSIGSRNLIAKKLNVLCSLEPWIAEGFVELAPYYHHFTSVSKAVQHWADADKEDSEWQKQAFSLASADFLEYIKASINQEGVDMLGKGDAALTARAVLSGGASKEIAQAYLLGSATDTLPITDSQKMWRLLQLWISRRLAAESAGGRVTDAFVRELKAGRAWLALDAKELVVLDKLEPAKILEIRNSSEYSFQDFRNDLGKAVEEIRGTGMEDEAAYREAAYQAWGKVRESADEIRKERPKLERRLAVDGVATVSGAALSLGLAPVAPGYALTTAMATAVGPGRDFVKSILDRQATKKSSGYFLLKLEEAESST